MSFRHPDMTEILKGASNSVVPSVCPFPFYCITLRFTDLIIHTFRCKEIHERLLKIVYQEKTLW